MVNVVEEIENPEVKRGEQIDTEHEQRREALYVQHWKEKRENQEIKDSIAFDKHAQQYQNEQKAKFEKMKSAMAVDKA